MTFQQVYDNLFLLSFQQGEKMEERFRTFTVLITKISRAIRKIKTEEMHEYGLSNPHVSCLYYLFKEKSLTAKEIMDICLEDKASISRAIAYLETNGYIECDTNQKKRYNSCFKLTALGQHIAEGIAEKIDNILAFASEGLSDEKRKHMYESLSLISENLDIFCNKYEGEK